MKHTYIFIAILLFVLILVSLFFWNREQKSMNNTFSSDTIRYVALGDSYTSGEGVSKDDRWPNMLVDQLREKGVEIGLVENPSVTGYTTQDVIEKELSIFENANPTFATLLIGANDLALGVDETTYRRNIEIILDHMQQVLPDKNNMVLVTIPDFSKTPRGRLFGSEVELMERIQRYNTILKKEGQERNIAVVDIFSISQNVEDDSSLIVPDGLHPSAQQYRQWVDIISPKAYEVIKNNE